MKQVGLLSSAALAFLITSIFVNQSSHTEPKAMGSPIFRGLTQAGSPANHQSTSEGSTGSSDVWSSATARRWLNSEPSHWRAMLLNR
jgi:hypothetical protein